MRTSFKLSPWRESEYSNRSSSDILLNHEAAYILILQQTNIN